MSHVEEFLPKTKQDPIVNELCRLFVSSFYEFYQTIEEKLNLPKEKSLKTWLEEAADQTIEEVIAHQARCFVVYTSSDEIAGFLTTKTDENDLGHVYISQSAMDPKFKRQGYGHILLKHLSTVYPPETTYIGVTRRFNQPALDFYRKCGAEFSDDEQLISKYGYNPLDYLAFRLSLHEYLLLE